MSTFYLCSCTTPLCIIVTHLLMLYINWIRPKWYNQQWWLCLLLNCQNYPIIDPMNASQCPVMVLRVGTLNQSFKLVSELKSETDRYICQKNYFNETFFISVVKLKVQVVLFYCKVFYCSLQRYFSLKDKFVLIPLVCRGIRDNK